ncbi:MAG: SDR family NAD(P)-dependent oxidoreductase [Gemmataceae bacterium]
MKRVALITGAGRRRIGQHVADALAERGYSIALHYHSSRADAEEAVRGYEARGLEAAAYQADIRDEGAVARMFEQALARFGRLDVLVNTAAVWDARKLEETDAAVVRHNFDTNVLGSFLCARAAGLAMVKQPEGGAIVNVGDWAEARPYLDYSAYFISKGAIPALTRSLAVELAARNPMVRVNCILPGPLMLPADLSEADKQNSIGTTLAQREGSPQHLAKAVLFFIDNDYVTGVSLPVDGGKTIYPSR